MLVCFGKVTRHDSLCKTVFQCTLEGGFRRGGQKKTRMYTVNEWTSYPRMSFSEQTTTYLIGGGSLPSFSPHPRSGTKYSLTLNKNNVG
ncbi:hypothetical protein DPMN_150820 [Dreissena polymorpha]|uniref:Uncharacterized protein n=1 Tax=Dreissena polymorpha TaxID=45954 RepID=A0A9D4FE40_DREPO|nr:hypothetical protein DPMN_150820 [Dreissena polymorpha]